jgi:uncharacterized damage-inducible protein DinB
MITLERALRHTAWADDKLFTAVAAMPASALTARYMREGRRVGETLMHIVGGAEWYRYVLGGGQWTRLEPPTNPTEVMIMRDHLGRVNSAIVAAVHEPDTILTFEDEGGTRTAWRSTILSQAVYHSIEHRAQIACALEVAGQPVIDLDEFDFWAYERAVG